MRRVIPTGNPAQEEAEAGGDESPSLKKQKQSASASKSAKKGSSALKKPAATTVKAEAANGAAQKIGPLQAEDEPLLWQASHMTLIRRARLGFPYQRLRQCVSSVIHLHSRGFISPQPWNLLRR